MRKVAILGVTGYIGKSLLSEFFMDKNKYDLFLFSRSLPKIKDTLKKYNNFGNSKININSFDEFYFNDYDVVINCSGIGDTIFLKKNPESIFKVTEEIDNMVINYLEKKPKTLYINLSSGAVYGDNFDKEINEKTKAILNINNFKISEYYSIAKINAEAKHRAMASLNIVDLRVFAFFSRFVDTSVGFFMSEVVDCIKNKKVLKTSQNNIMRDYVSPQDLFSLIKLIFKKKKINDFFDVYSLKQVSKFEILSFIKKKYGLMYVFEKNRSTDTKNKYYSRNKKAEHIGYVPKFTSLESIEVEINKIK